MPALTPSLSLPLAWGDDAPGPGDAPEPRCRIRWRNVLTGTTGTRGGGAVTRAEAEAARLGERYRGLYVLWAEEAG